MSPLSYARPIARYIAPLLGVSRRFSRHDDGATTIEYGLICVFIGLAVLAVVVAINMMRRSSRPGVAG